MYSSVIVMEGMTTEFGESQLVQKATTLLKWKKIKRYSLILIDPKLSFPKKILSSFWQLPFHPNIQFVPTSHLHCVIWVEGVIFPLFEVTLFIGKIGGAYVNRRPYFQIHLLIELSHCLTYFLKSLWIIFGNFFFWKNFGGSLTSS